jgi:hypothetical protein
MLFYIVFHINYSDLSMIFSKVLIIKLFFLREEQQEKHIKFVYICFIFLFLS